MERAKPLACRQMMLAVAPGFGRYCFFWQLVWTDHGRSSDVRSGLDISVSPDCWRLQNSVAILKFSVSVPDWRPHPERRATLILRASSGVIGECYVVNRAAIASNGAATEISGSACTS